MNMEFKPSSELNKYIFGFLVILFRVTQGRGETCDFGRGNFKSCDYGCCDDDCCSYQVSTTVLIVAGIIGGLIVVALVVATVICCIKTYRDKRASRARQVRPGQRHHNEDHIPRRPVEPRKPPEYTEEPPPYSSEMPESHYRPVTVSSHYMSYNQRFRTPVMQNYPRYNQTVTTNHSGVHATRSDGVNPQNRNRVRRIGVVGIPEVQEDGNQQSNGSSVRGPPPTYSEVTSAQVEAQRRRRFIQTPPQSQQVSGTAANSQVQNISEVSNSQASESSDRRSVTTRQSSNSHNSLTTQDTVYNRPDTNASRNNTAISRREVTASRQDTVASRQSNFSTTPNTSNTQTAQTNDTAFIRQTQTPINSDSSQETRTQQLRNSLLAGTNARQGLSHSNMEAAVSRARSRQMQIEVTPQPNQAVSRRHADNFQSETRTNNSIIQDLACL